MIKGTKSIHHTSQSVKMISDLGVSADATEAATTSELVFECNRSLLWRRAMMKSFMEMGASLPRTTSCSRTFLNWLSPTTDSQWDRHRWAATLKPILIFPHTLVSNLTHVFLLFFTLVWFFTILHLGLVPLTQFVPYDRAALPPNHPVHPVVVELVPLRALLQDGYHHGHRTTLLAVESRRILLQSPVFTPAWCRWLVSKVFLVFLSLQ